MTKQLTVTRLLIILRLLSLKGAAELPKTAPHSHKDDARTRIIAELSKDDATKSEWLNIKSSTIVSWITKIENACTEVHEDHMNNLPYKGHAEIFRNLSVLKGEDPASPELAQMHGLMTAVGKTLCTAIREHAEKETRDREAAASKAARKRDAVKAAMTPGRKHFAKKKKVAPEDKKSEDDDESEDEDVHKKRRRHRRTSLPEGSDSDASSADDYEGVGSNFAKTIGMLVSKHAPLPPPPFAAALQQAPTSSSAATHHSADALRLAEMNARIEAEKTKQFQLQLQIARLQAGVREGGGESIEDEIL